MWENKQELVHTKCRSLLSLFLSAVRIFNPQVQVLERGPNRGVLLSLSLPGMGASVDTAAWFGLELSISAKRTSLDYSCWVQVSGIKHKELSRARALKIVFAANLPGMNPAAAVSVRSHLLSCGNLPCKLDVRLLHIS